jgi:hypothetical protein
MTLNRLLLSMILIGLCAAWTAQQAEAQSPSASQLQISFVLQAPTDLHPEGSILLRPDGGSGELVRLAVRAGSAPSVQLPPGSKWEISADLPGFWAPRKNLTAGSAGQPQTLSLDLWPMGTVSGVVRPKDKKSPLPKQIVVKTLATPAILKRPAAPQGALDCTVDDKGAWRCPLPAATFDLVIAAEGYIPHYRWAQKIPPGKTLSLGTLQLERGSSVAAWVAVEEGAIEPGRCLARLRPMAAGGTDLRSASDLARTAVEREIRKDGFLQMTGLSPGIYALEVQQPGYTPVKVQPVRVDPGAETFLRNPLILKKPLDLSFEIRPPIDWLGQPWRARVFRTTDRTVRPVPLIFEGPADEEGRLVVSGQSSGSFKIDLTDSLGNRLFSDERELADPAPQVLEVELVTVEGRLFLGREPLRGTLWFGGRYGPTSITMESDEEGQFHGVLPTEGPWKIEVQAAEPSFQTWTRTVVRADRSGKAKLEIKLSDTRVFGRVVDEHGKPAVGANLLVQSDNDLLLQVDEQGRFELRGVPEGLIWLAAQLSDRASDRISTTIAEGREAGPIELRLHEIQRLTGTVSSPLGPVAGSRVLVVSRFPDGGGGAATTGLDGSFTVELPRVSPRVTAIVSAPGFALRAVDVATEGAPLSLRVTEEAGSLEITLPQHGEGLAVENKIGAVFQNGLYIPGSVLNLWAYDQSQPRSAAGGKFLVPGVAPGDYRVCIVPRPLEPSLASGAIPEGVPCDQGVLSPGSTLSLKPGA